MKSVLRSVFDPVPRPLSPGAQLLVVGVLVVGITISVFEFLENSQPAALAQEQQRRQPASFEVRAPASGELGSRPRSLVRANPRASGPAATANRGTSEQPLTGIGAETSSPGAASMSLQPDGDG